MLVESFPGNPVRMITSSSRPRRVDVDRFPEWEPFAHAVQQRRPEAGTWCEAWTVRDIVIHQTGNAEELARVLAAHLAGVHSHRREPLHPRPADGDTPASPNPGRAVARCRDLAAAGRSTAAPR